MSFINIYEEQKRLGSLREDSKIAYSNYLGGSSNNPQIRFGIRRDIAEITGFKEGDCVLLLIDDQTKQVVIRREKEGFTLRKNPGTKRGKLIFSFASRSKNRFPKTNNTTVAINDVDLKTNEISFILPSS